VVAHDIDPIDIPCSGGTMEERPLADAADLNEQIVATCLAEDDLCAQSVDLSQWFSTGLTPTGSFDLGIVAATQFGNLLDALPVPILMIDGSYDVVYANKACAKLSPNYERIQGVPFTTLVPRSRNAEKAKWLLRKVFATRRPQVADGIIQMEAKKIWGRLHFSSIRIGRERYVLLLIEDLTGEKTQLLINRRDDSQFQRTVQELEKHVTTLTAELEETRSKLAREKSRHLKTLDAHLAETRKTRALAEFVSEPVAIIAADRTCEYLNATFRESFGYPGLELPDLSDWWKKMNLPECKDVQAIMNHLEALADTELPMQSFTSGSVTDAAGMERTFFLKAVRLNAGGYVVVCSGEG
jgi:PAS domain S-box-containing protein